MFSPRFKETANVRHSNSPDQKAFPSVFAPFEILPFIYFFTLRLFVPINSIACEKYFSSIDGTVGADESASQQFST